MKKLTPSEQYFQNKLATQASSKKFWNSTFPNYAGTTILWLFFAFMGVLFWLMLVMFICITANYAFKEDIKVWLRENYPHPSEYQSK